MRDALDANVAGWHHPGHDLDPEPPRQNSGIGAVQIACSLWIDRKHRDPPQALVVLTDERPRRDDLTTVVKGSLVRKMCILKGGCFLLGELRRIRRPHEQYKRYVYRTA